MSELSAKRVAKFETDAVPALRCLQVALDNWNETPEDERTVKQQSALKTFWAEAKRQMRRCGVGINEDGTLVAV